VRLLVQQLLEIPDSFWKVVAGDVQATKLMRPTITDSAEWAFKEVASSAGVFEEVESVGMPNGTYSYFAFVGELYLRAVPLRSSFSLGRSRWSAGRVAMQGILMVENRELVCWTNTTDTAGILTTLPEQATLSVDLMWVSRKKGTPPSTGCEVIGLPTGDYLEAPQLCPLIPTNAGTLQHDSGTCDVCTVFYPIGKPYRWRDVRCDANCPRCHHPDHGIERQREYAAAREERVRSRRARLMESLRGTRPPFVEGFNRARRPRSPYEHTPTPMEGVVRWPQAPPTHDNAGVVPQPDPQELRDSPFIRPTWPDEVPKETLGDEQRAPPIGDDADSLPTHSDADMVPQPDPEELRDAPFSTEAEEPLGDEEHERRRAPDGNWYTKEEFYQRYRYLLAL